MSCHTRTRRACTLKTEPKYAPSTRASIIVMRKSIFGEMYSSIDVVIPMQITYTSSLKSHQSSSNENSVKQTDYINSDDTFNFLFSGICRDVAGKYAVELRRVLITLVDLICEGLGINSEHYRDELTKVQKLAMNYYPRCPDPSQVLGLAPHDDINPLTVLIEHTEYPGYQIFRNGKWLAVAPPKNSLIVNFGFTFEVKLYAFLINLIN